MQAEVYCLAVDSLGIIKSWYCDIIINIFCCFNLSIYNLSFTPNVNLITNGQH